MPGGERYQCQRVTPVQGQFGYLPVLYDLAQRAGGRIQNVGVPSHLQRLAHLSDFERHVNGDRLLNADLDGLLYETLESGVFEFQAVIAGRKRRKAVCARLVRQLFTNLACIHVGKCDGPAGDDGTPGVGDQAGNDTGCGLAHRSYNHDQQRQKTPSNIVRKARRS